MTDYEKLKNIIDEITELQHKQVTYYLAEFKAWYSKTSRFLLNKYGQKSFEYKDFQNIQFQSMIPDARQEIIVCINGLNQARATLSNYLEELVLEEDKTEQKTINTDFSKVFIVHGHDGELKEAVARIVEKQGLKAIILSEQANEGKTIIEKIEAHSDVSSAICLFTADDVGKKKTDLKSKPRARQNVVFEAGYFMGKLGRDKLVIISEKGLELPSDMSGVVYTDKANWEISVLKELKAIGYAIDYNKID